MFVAVSLTSWIQILGIVIAAAAAALSAVSVRQARNIGLEAQESAETFLQAVREPRQPILLLEPAISFRGGGPRRLSLSVYNPGDIALDVSVVLIGHNELLRHFIGVMKPEETFRLDTNLKGTGSHRAVGFAISKDGDRWVWDQERERRPFPDSADDILAVFYPDEDFRGYSLANSDVNFSRGPGGPSAGIGLGTNINWVGR